MDSENTIPPSPASDDDVSDEELAAALALIKKRRADAARQQVQQAAPVPVPRPAPVSPNVAPVSHAAVWPPAPRATATSAPPVLGVGGALSVPELPAPILGACPSCQRKLLTRTSALCNWCGAKINNEDYQEQAARTRQEMDDAIRQAAELRAQDAPSRTVLGRLKKRLKPGGTSAPQT